MACHLIMKMNLKNPHEWPEEIMIAGFWGYCVHEKTIKHSITEAMKGMNAFVHITAQYRDSVKWRKQTPVFIIPKILNQRKLN